MRLTFVSFFGQAPLPPGNWNMGFELDCDVMLFYLGIGNTARRTLIYRLMEIIPN